MNILAYDTPVQIVYKRSATSKKWDGTQAHIVDYIKSVTHGGRDIYVLKNHRLTFGVWYDEVVPLLEKETLNEDT